jgi:adenylate kinase family enzyme
MAHSKPLPPMPGRRISIVGTAGCGKTTLARRLALLLNLPHVELDALFWGPAWTPMPRERFRELAAAALAGDAWIVDGNYSVVRDIINSRGDTLVWLDYSLLRILGRLLRRTFRRVFSRELLWGTNRERLSNQLGRDSLLLYAARTYGRRRRLYRSLSDDPACAHLTVIWLRSPRETERWLGALSRSCRESSC